MTVKSQIKGIFGEVKHKDSFLYFLFGLGFRRAPDGIRKLVFISPRHDFVVKLARDGKFTHPTKGSIIGKFYLRPEKVAVRQIKGTVWHLTFQPKGDIRHQRKTFLRLEAELFKANTAWRSDAHQGNVALHRGRPVIIDY